jgi:AraC family transcriptional regulator of adaptative response/methylated-DNA-[protein]-cysteine methyltransferase
MLVAAEDARREFYEALVRKDPSYLGSFFVGVTTTGVFCVPTCRARKPRPENAVFFTELRDALAHGYRPCKLCRPTEAASEPPGEVRAALDLLKEEPKRKVGDAELRDRGLGPERVRRWFKLHYGITFQAYQRMVRINTAVEELRTDASVTRAAFDSGYDSLSGFSYTYKKLMGGSPAAGKARPTICLERILTPLGPMFAGATERGLCLLEFTDRRMLETELGDLQRRLGAVALMGGNEHTRRAALELAEYFSGTRTTFGVPLDAPGTDFQRAVWEVLRTIPYGETRSYREQAERLGNPAAVRAVASANGRNRIAVIIPCHRVIGKDGSLTGYGGGLERKRWLIAHERGARERCGHDGDT